MADHIRLSLKMHVVLPEYAGYGIYRGMGGTVKPSTERLLDDALTVFNYFTGGTISEAEFEAGPMANEDVEVGAEQ